VAPSCDLCGHSEAHLRARVAGAEAVVCDRCARLGTVIGEIEARKKPSEIKKIEQKKTQIVERVTEVVEDIGPKVHKTREELGWKQEDLAKKISEHESMVKRIEHGYIPSPEIAKKLERALHIKLTEMVIQNEQEYVSSKGAGALTLGDIMVVKKKAP
jgi:uncharacterized protein (TIGR00270 family)